MFNEFLYLSVLLSVTFSRGNIRSILPWNITSWRVEPKCKKIPLSLSVLCGSVGTINGLYISHVTTPPKSPGTKSLSSRACFCIPWTHHVTPLFASYSAVSRS